VSYHISVVRVNYPNPSASHIAIDHHGVKPLAGHKTIFFICVSSYQYGVWSSGVPSLKRGRACEYSSCLYRLPLPGNKNSPTVTHACRKRRLKWVPGARGYNWATLPLGDINTEAWSSRMGVGHGANNPTL
jgi:hypothetical protein